MKGTANLNALALTELINTNTSIHEISIDIDLDLVDDDMVKVIENWLKYKILKLEEALMENTTLLWIKAPRFEISMSNRHTANLYKLLKANEWITRNYDKLCRNELIDCNVNHNKAFLIF